MVSLIITSMMAMSLIMAGSYVAFSTLQSSQKVSDAQRNAAQMWRLATLVEANLRPVHRDGVLYPPAPSLDVKGRPGLPEWLATNARAPWGAPYAYCVYAATANAIGTIATAPYPYAGAPGAHDYAVSAPALPAALAGRDIVALILASAVRTENPPRCEDVTLDQGVPALSGGGQVVTVGQRATSDMAALAASARVERWVTPLPQGNGTGVALTDGMVLEAALGLWQATRPITCILHLAPGRHTVSDTLLRSLADDSVPAGGRLVLAGLGSGVVVSGDGGTLTLPADLRVEGITFTGLALAAQPGTRLEFHGANAVSAPPGVPPVRTNHASLMIGGTLALAGDGDAIRVVGGQALIRDAEITAAVGRGGSAIMTTMGAQLTLASETRRSRLTVSGGNAPLTALRVGGASAILDHTDVVLADVTQFGVVLEAGALEMNATGLGQSNARAVAGGVLDIGGARVAGDNNTYIWVTAGTNCVHGALFSQPTQPLPVQSPTRSISASALVPSVSNPASRASWTCRS